MVEAVEDEGGEGDEDQWEEVPFGSHHWLGFRRGKIHSCIGITECKLGFSRRRRRRQISTMNM